MQFELNIIPNTKLNSKLNMQVIKERFKCIKLEDQLLWSLLFHSFICLL